MTSPFSKDYQSAIDWKPQQESVKSSVAATKRRAKGMASEDVQERIAASGFISGMGSEVVRADLVKKRKG